VKCHSFGKAKGYIKCFIKLFRKKFKEQYIANFYFIHIIGPVYHHAAPYHDGEQGKVDPMKPPDGKRVFVNYLFHKKQLLRIKKPLRISRG
jgi:hypothetical protein